MKLILQAIKALMRRLEQGYKSGLDKLAAALKELDAKVQELRERGAVLWVAIEYGSPPDGGELCWYCDRTLADITAAHKAGMVVRATDQGTYYDLRYVEEGDGYTIAYFTGQPRDGSPGIDAFEIYNFGDGDEVSMREPKILATLDDIPEGTGGATPDWNADPGEQGHILNRTHYDEWETVIPETVVEDIDGILGISAPGELKTGEKYRATINGVSYETVAKSIQVTEDDITATITGIGDFEYILGMVEESTGEPFAAMSAPIMSEEIDFAAIGEFAELPTISLHHFGAVPIPFRYMPEPCVVSLNYADFTTNSIDVSGMRLSWADLEYKDYDVSELARAWVEKRPITIEIYAENNGVRSVVSRLTPTSFNPLVLLVDPSQYLDNPDVLNGRTWWRITAMGCISNGIDANFIDISLGYVDF